MSRTGQMKTKLMDVVDSLDALERTPNTFRWTPAMSAIWPKDYRPTMTGLLAMWEAMHDAAEYSCSQAASDDGWIEWDGSQFDPCTIDLFTPVQKGTLVDVKFRDGVIYERVQAGVTLPKMREAAGSFWRNENEGNDIIAYRVIK